MSNLKTDIGNIKGIGPKKKAAFIKLGVETLEDALHYYPRKYKDFSVIFSISQIYEIIGNNKFNKWAKPLLVKGKIFSIKSSKTFGRRTITSIILKDNNLSLEIIFFNVPYLGKQLYRGCEYYFFGKIEINNSGKLVMKHPEIIQKERINYSLEPVYPLSKGLGQKDISKVVKVALNEEIKEIFSSSLIEDFNICSLDKALNNLHFPNSKDELRKALERMKFQELFMMIMQLERAKVGALPGLPHSASCTDFLKALPFKLTIDQSKVIDEIDGDMKSKYAMNRLLQGDVGSGKTVVAFAALYKAVKSGFQGAMMVPTEILARQHFEEAEELFGKFGIKCRLLVGSLGAKEKKQIYSEVSRGHVDIIIGTHSLIQKEINYNNLGLVVTDEQHRFGVNQRFRLKEKGISPHVLMMTATPIPRTLTVVLYGDVSVSSIKTMPEGRKPVITKVCDNDNRENAYALMEEQIKSGRQAYVLVPLVSENPDMELKSLEETYEYIQNRSSGKYKVAFVYGSMNKQNKDEVMKAFYDGHIDVLVATTVIEVGVNVPNATVMIIEDSQRFGLAQLHQLRGRVGRGKYQSYCYLVVRAGKGSVAHMRGLTMEESQDGFYIAEKDLEQRGPGELFGLRQHGLPDLRFANIGSNIQLVEEIRNYIKENNLADIFWDKNFRDKNNGLYREPEKYIIK